MTENFFEKWLIFWSGAKKLLADTEGFPDSSINGIKLIEKVQDLDEKEIGRAIKKVISDHDNSNPPKYISIEDVFDALGGELEEIATYQDLNKKQSLSTYSVGIGSLKDIFGDSSPWMKNIFTLLKEIFDLLSIKYN